jgi:hypothetical protein
MRLVAIVLNAVMLPFTVMVVVSDGMPTKAIYILFTLFMLALPVATVYALWRRRPAVRLVDRNGVAIAPLERLRVAIGALNVLMIVAVITAIIDQYPHPDEPGFLTYVLVVCVTPLVSAWVLLRSRGAEAARTGAARTD